MRETIRRILWIAPTLVVTSLVAFWVLASRLPLAGAEELPVFVNLEPRSVRELAGDALHRIARGEDDATEAAAALAQLGGAALPHVLPRLDELDPAARGQVAVALGPVAVRMGVGDGERLEDPDAAVAFWTRFWRDRSIDFHPTIVRRLVRRYAERPSVLRRSEILQLDTFALGEIVRALRDVSAAGDADRVAHLDGLARHIAGRPGATAGTPTLQEARATAEEWQRFWSTHEARFSTLDGAQRVAAMIGETQYGRWVGDVARRDLGTTGDGMPVVTTLARRAPTTLWLAFGGLLAGYAAGMAWSLSGVVSARAAGSYVAAAVAVGVAATPVVALATATSRAGGGLAIGTLLMVVAGAAVSSRHAWDGVVSGGATDWARTLRSQGASELRVGLRATRVESARLFALLAPDFPATVTAAFVVERALGLPGLGEPTIGALASGDVAWLMTVALLLTSCAAALQIFGDVAATALDPRVRVGQRRLAGGTE